MKHRNNPNNNNYNGNFDRRSKADRDIERLQATIAYQERTIRDLSENVRTLRHFALQQIFFDKDLVERLGKSYLPAAPCLERPFEQIED